MQKERVVADECMGISKVEKEVSVHRQRNCDSYRTREKHVSAEAGAPGNGKM